MAKMMTCLRMALREMRKHYALAYQQNLKDCGTKLRQTELEKRRCSHTTNKRRLSELRFS